MEFKSKRGQRTIKLAAFEMRHIADTHNLLEEIALLVGRGHPLYGALREANAKLFQIRGALPDLDLNQLAPEKPSESITEEKPTQGIQPSTNGHAAADSAFGADGLPLPKPRGSRANKQEAALATS